MNKIIIFLATISLAMLIWTGIMLNDIQSDMKDTISDLYLIDDLLDKHTAQLDKLKISSESLINKVDGL